MRAVAALVASLSAAGCADDPASTATTTSSPPAGCEAGAVAAPDGGCLAAGTRADGCPAGEHAIEAGSASPSTDGTCAPAGIPAAGCADGFVGEPATGCAAVLPPAPCAPGTMAIPGETQCREVAPCAAGTWGDIPVDAGTQYVDATYAGADSDGSAAKPWTTIQAAVDAASAGAVVAIADGAYAESVYVAGKAVQLWGRCPGSTRIVGPAAKVAGVDVRSGADGTAIRSVAITGSAMGIALAGSVDIVIDHVWIHGLPDRGINAQSTIGPVTFSVTDSLIEDVRGNGVYAAGVGVTVEHSVIRGTRPASGAGFGRGIVARMDPDTDERATLVVSGSLLDDNRDIGVLVEGADGTVEASVVRHTRGSGGEWGWGIAITDARPGGERAVATVRSSVVEDNESVGIDVNGADAVVEATTLRRTTTVSEHAPGIEVRDDDETGQRGSLTLRSSVVAESQGLGILIGGSDAMLEDVRVRDISSSGTDRGAGIAIQPDDASGQPGSATVVGCVVERAYATGIYNVSADMTLEGVLVRDTHTADSGLFGIGVVSTAGLGPEEHSTSALRSCRIDGSHHVGLVVANADATVESTWISATASRGDGAFGDGVMVTVDTGHASATVTGCRIDGSARAGISTFGADVSVDTTSFDCNLIDLDVETFNGSAPKLADAGGNVCGCAAESRTCRAISSSLVPPELAPPP